MRKLVYALLALLALQCEALALSTSSIPSDWPKYWAQGAGSSYVRTIPVPSQIGIQGGAASLTDGFPPLTFTPIEGGGVPPFGQDMNGILRQVSQWNQWQNVGGPVFYDATVSSAVSGYPAGAIIGAANQGNYWESTANNNTSDPDSGGANWLGFSPWYMYASDGGSANAGSVTLPITLSSLATIQGRPLTIKKISSANTSGYSLTVNTFTATVVHMDGTAVVTGDLAASSLFTVIYDGTYFRLQSPVSTSGLGQAAFKNVSNNSDATVASVCASGASNGALASFSDNNGTVCNSGLPAANVALAWVVFAGTGSDGPATIVAAQNVSGVSRTGSGTYTIATSNVTLATGGFPSVTSDATNTLYGEGALVSPGTNPSVGVTFSNRGGGGSQDPGDALVVLYGK